LSPVVIVPKKWGRWKVCVDYRAPNKVTKRDRQPLPFIDELLDSVAGHEFYSFFDGYSGYHQVKIHQDGILKTTFTTPWGTYAFLRMPFGLCNAGGTFQRVQLKVFGPYIGKFIRVFLDDFAVYGDRKLYLSHVRTAFQRLAEHICSLSPEKCKLGFEEGPILEHIVFIGGIKVDPTKVQRILELEEPRNARQVSTLWGVTLYHTRFIENLVGRAKPITSLIRKSTEFKWSNECKEAMAYICQCLSSNPVMKNPDWQIPFIINPSALEISVAAVLLQNDAAGRAHPVYYASRLLNSCEVKYSEPEKITVALLFACTKFKYYLLSSPFPIIVQCKKDGLKQMIQQIDPAGRPARLITTLQQYDLIVKGVRGQRSAHAKLLLELGSPPAIHEGALLEPEAEAECYALHQQNNDDFGYKQIIDYLSELRLPEGATPTQRQEIKRKNKLYTLIGETLYRAGADGTLRRVVEKEET
jgi:hypothetical protein